MVLADRLKQLSDTYMAVNVSTEGYGKEKEPGWRAGSIYEAWHHTYLRERTAGESEAA